MSIRSIMAFAIILATAACTDEPVPPDESTVDQETRLPLECPAGDYVFEWDTPRGACGGCTIGTTPSQVWDYYAACANDLLRTKKLMKTTCVPC